MSAGPAGDTPLRDAVEAICEQLCRVAAGDLSVRLAAPGGEVAAQKLALLGNGVLHVARRALETASAKERELAEAHAMARLGTWSAEIVPGGAARMTWSPELGRLLGLDPAALPAGSDLTAGHDRIHPADRARVAAAHEAATRGSVESYEWRALCPDGTERVIWTELRPVRGPDGAVVGLRGVCQDVTERRAAEARIRHLAEHDSLTGLHNRAVLRDRLAKALAHRGRRAASGALAPRRVALLCVDLDGFKAVNDRLGHAAGDRVLAEAARRLRRAARGGDTLARLGGDEFAIVQSGAEDAQPGAAERLGARIVEALSAPYVLVDGGPPEAAVTASVGVAFGPGDGDGPDALLAAADTALYAAKTSGKNAVRLFDPAMEVEARDRRALEADLRLAAARGELHLLYQPLVAVEDGRVQGYEALLRWHHPQRGAVPPDRFIPVAEACGAILPLGEWVLRRACADAARWPGAPFVAVNVSPVQVQRGAAFAEAVAKALAETGLPPGRLELEVTEGVLMRDADAALDALRRVRALGVRVALDDFGTGYSSLATLQAFPFDKIKVDRRFVAGVGEGPDTDDAAILRAVLGLARGLRLPVVAEGVETRAQLAALREERCAMAQGWLFGRPGPGPEAEDVRDANQRDGAPPSRRGRAEAARPPAPTAAQPGPRRLRDKPTPPRQPCTDHGLPSKRASSPA